MATTSPVSGDSAKTAPTRTLTSLVRTKTNQRSRPAEILGQKAQRQTTVHTVDDKADLASLHDAGNRLSLRMPEDLRQRFSPKDKEKIAALEYEMEQLAAEGVRVAVSAFGNHWGSYITTQNHGAITQAHWPIHCATAMMLVRSWKSSLIS